jgi:hypothetical protein
MPESTDPRDAYDLTPPDQQSAPPASPPHSAPQSSPGSSPGSAAGSAAGTASGAAQPVSPAVVDPLFSKPLTEGINVTDADLDELKVEPEPETPIHPVRKRPEPVAAKASTTPDGGAAQGDQRPFNRMHRVEWPLAVAGCAAAIFIAACLGGQAGLFPQFGEKPIDPTVVDRVLLVLRGLLMMILCGGSLVAGAAIAQTVEKRPLGDLRSLGAVMLMVAALSLLVRITPIGIHPLFKQGFDLLAPIGIAWLLVVALFRVPFRDAGMVIGAAILSLVVLAFGSTIVSFALWAGASAGAAATS